LIAGLAVYIILSYLLVPVRITIPLAIIISVLIFGLTKYYATNNIYNNNNKSQKVLTTTINAATTSHSAVLSNLNEVELKRRLQQREMDQKEEINNINRGVSIVKNNNNSSNNYTLSLFANFFFIVGYTACLLIVTAYFFIFNPTNEIFVPWEQFTIVQIIELGASIALCFFLPGYALLSILFKDDQIRPLLKVILAYFLSILVTGLTGYIAVSTLGLGSSDIIGLFIIVYLSILIVLLIQQLSLISLEYNNQIARSKYFFRNLSLKIHTFELVKCQVWNFLKRNSAEFIVFASLLSLVVLSTYSLLSGVIVGDQWYHHGRSLLFMSGEFRDIAVAGADARTFSPFPSALLASFFSLSGIPSVNAYASIGFLNIIPVFAFYYFFKNWVPIRMKKAALLACTLFILSSGFGWVYVLGLAVTDPLESELSVLQMLYQAGIKTVDIILGTSFIGAENPGFSTPLIFMALPIGFTLLGLLRDDIINKGRFKYLAILLSTTFLGTLSHDEFYLFIIIASIVPIFLFFIAETRDKKKKDLIVVYVALVSALLLTVVLATYSFAGVGYFTWNYILGIPLLVLCLIFVTIMCILYTAIRFFDNLFYRKKYRNVRPQFQSLLSPRPWIKYLYDHKHITLSPRLVLVLVIAWLYIVTFIVWSQLPQEAVEIQSINHTVPWYLYPIKLGVTGLLGFAFVLSYLFRKFEKEIFVFGIIVVVAFVSGPYYYEHRLNKYIMAGLAGFASLFIYSLIIKYPHIQKISPFRILSTGLVLGIIIFSSALSVLMYWGYTASAHDSEPDQALNRKDFPPASEFELYRLLRDNNQDSLAFNVAAPVKEYDPSLPADLIGKVNAFSGVPWTKLTQSPLTLDAYTLESFYDLLHHSNTRYIVLPKEDFVNLINESEKDGEMEITDRGRQQLEDEEERDGGQGQLNVTLREKQRGAEVTNIIRFAIENFKKAYEDSKYLVLAVPPFSPAQSQADIGFVHKKSELLASPLASDKDAIFTLPYDRELFQGIDNPRIVINEDKNAAIYGIKEGRTGLWTDLRELQQRRNANYFESTFRIVRQNDSEINYAGIVWNDTHMEYTLTQGKDTLDVSIQPTDVRNSTSSNDGRLVHVAEINRESGAWYTIKIMYTERTVNIYVNNVLAIQFPTNHHSSASELYQRTLSNSTSNADTNASLSTNTTIHKIELYSVNNVAEFRPIKVGEVTTEADRNQKMYFEHYYPLSMLALSKLKYDTFLDGDMSALSKKTVILNLDTLLSSLASGVNGTFTENDYLKFVNRGGTLVVMNIDDIDFFGEPILFEELLDIRDEVKFDGISYEPQRSQQHNKEEMEKEGGKQEEKEQESQSLNVSGVAREILIRNNSATSDVIIKSYYKNNDNQKVTPFAIEKKYGMGRLIFLNSGGYFDAVAGSPQQTFPTLAKILNFAGLDTVADRNYADNGTENSISGGVMPNARIDGDLKIYGNIKINSSSFSVVPDNNNAYGGGYNSYRNNKFYVQGVNSSVSDYKSISRNSDNSSSKYYDIEKEDRRNNHTVIEDLRLSGPYEVIIYLNGSLVLPSPIESSYNYIGTSISPGSDIVLKLHNGSAAKFVAINDTGQRLFEFSDYGEIHLSNVSETANRANVSVLLKSPEIRVTDGKIKFDNLYNIDPSYLTKLDLSGTFDPSGRAKFESSSICRYTEAGRVDCSPLEVNGKMDAILDHVDNYHGINYPQGIYANSLSYIKSLDIEQDKTGEKTNKMDLKLKLPGDISQLAKERGITVPWQKALFSNIGLAVSISMFVYGAVVVILIMKLWRPSAKKMTD
jgi:hypothetical protein